MGKCLFLPENYKSHADFDKSAGQNTWDKAAAERNSFNVNCKYFYNYVEKWFAQLDRVGF